MIAFWSPICWCLFFSLWAHILFGTLKYLMDHAEIAQPFVPEHVKKVTDVKFNPSFVIFYCYLYCCLWICNNSKMWLSFVFHCILQVAGNNSEPVAAFSERMLSVCFQTHKNSLKSVVVDTFFTERPQIFQSWLTTCALVHFWSINCDAVYFVPQMSGSNGCILVKLHVVGFSDQRCLVFIFADTLV